MDQITALRADIHRAEGPLFAQIRIAAGKLPLVLPPRDGTSLKNRFREALPGLEAHAQRQARPGATPPSFRHRIQSRFVSTMPA